MGAPTSEVGYTPAKPRREDHEVHKGHVVALDQKKLQASRGEVSSPTETYTIGDGINNGGGWGDLFRD